MNTRKFVLATLISCASALVCSISMTLSWFLPKNAIKSDQFDGSVLKSYFHSGDGSIENPFVITRPRHYENLVMLYYQMPGFASAVKGIEYTDEHGVVIRTKDSSGNLMDNTFHDEAVDKDFERSYYFEIGAKLVEGDNNYYVYSYENGVQQFENSEPKVSKELNLDCFVGEDSLSPLGSIDYPFISHVEGHNMTISGFEIKGSGFADIGVFGYVGPGGACENLYFKDYTIDTSGADASYDNESEYHVTHEHGINAYTGYIAGHIYTARFFKNVYTNNCVIKGQSKTYAHVNNYSYYGMVEKDVDMGDFGSGNNYKFTLDSSAIYDYLDNYYTTGIMPADDDDPELTNGLKDTAMRVRNTEYDSSINPATEDGSRKVGFSTGISQDNNGTRRLVGDYYSGWRKQDATRNYSFSTLGYYGYKIDSQKNEYETYYKDGSEYKVPSERTKTTVYPINEQPTGGEYFYFNKTSHKWEYYITDNYSIGTQYQVTFNFDSFTDDAQSTLWNRWLDTGNSSITAYVDDQIITCNYWNGEGDEPNEWYYTYVHDNSGNNNYYTITISPLILELQEGVHSYAFISHTYYTGGLSTRQYYRYIGTKSSNKINQVKFTLENGNPSEENEFIYPTHALTNNNTTSVSIGTTTAWSPVIVIGTHNYTYDLEGKKTRETEYHDLVYKSTTFEFAYDRWYAHEVTRDVIKGSEGPVYIADDPNIVGSGYNAKNIDIVGGGVTFGETYLNLNSDRTNSGVVVNPTIGNKFYATQCCGNSVVLYLKNVGTENLGRIEVNYSTLGALVGISLKAPAFKKSASSFYDFSDTHFEHYVHNDEGLIRTIEISQLSFSEVKKASFCGIDDNGIVRAIYDTNGNPSAQSNPDLVTKFVMVLGVQSTAIALRSSTNNTRITKIEFEYKADEGFGGTFGNVGYRYEGDSLITSTILNFYYYVPSGDYDYYVSVEYIETNKGNSGGVYNIIFTSSQAINVKLYLYNTALYTYTVNGGPPINNEMYEFTTTPGSYTYS